MPRGNSRAALSALLFLAACGGADRPAEAPSGTLPGQCRLAPDDGPPLADRGIGGTGAVADRGIGGTGAAARIADRGIGGTGIIAVITGFASICLGGVEVALDDVTPITLNGAPVPAAALRAGQLAIVEATGSATALTARSVALRQEVSGPVEAVGTDGRLRVAGQPVQLSSATFGERRPQVGQWVAVSGLRGPDGVVQATRIDPRSPGEVLVRGQALVVDGRPRIGSLELGPGAAVEAGGFVSATGRYRGGALIGARLEPDRLAADPAAAFPAMTRRILVESYAVAGQGGLRLGMGPMVPSAGGIGGAGPRRSVVELERQPDGGLRAQALRWHGPAPVTGPQGSVLPPVGGRTGFGGGPGQGAQPAPVPRRMQPAEGGPPRLGSGQGMPDRSALPPRNAPGPAGLPPGPLPPSGDGRMPPGPR